MAGALSWHMWMRLHPKDDRVESWTLSSESQAIVELSFQPWVSTSIFLHEREIKIYLV